VPEVLLHRAEIPPTEPEQFHARGMTERVRMNLGYARAYAIFVGWTGLVPREIVNFGLTFAEPQRAVLLRLFVAIVGYYTVAFIVYAFSDFLSYIYALSQRNEELRRQSEEAAQSMNTISQTPINISVARASRP
jgi:hypothetical protein